MQAGHLPCFDRYCQYQPEISHTKMQPTFAYSVRQGNRVRNDLAGRLGALYRITGINYFTQGTYLGNTTMQA